MGKLFFLNHGKSSCEVFCSIFVFHTYIIYIIYATKRHQCRETVNLQMIFHIIDVHWLGF